MPLPNLSGIPPVDLKNLQDLRSQPSEGCSLFDKIYPIFKDEAPKLVDEIQIGFSAKDETGTYDPMHKLKGSASAMGATRLFELAQAGLNMCREGRVFEETDLVEALGQEVKAYMESVDSLFPS